MLHSRTSFRGSTPEACGAFSRPSLSASFGTGHIAAKLHAASSCATVVAKSLTKRVEDLGVTGSVDGLPHGSAVTTKPRPAPRTSLRMGLPSKGRMAEDTMLLLKESALSVYKPNPRQYVASIPQIPALEVWFQRASDVVRKLRYGDIDLGIVGTDMFAELADGDPDLIVCHEALNFGQCKLALGIPMTGKFADIETLDQLRAMPNWSADSPLRVVTGYHNIATNFFRKNGFKHVIMMGADGALEAAPAMGSADIILDLVSTGVTLRENNLKEVQGGTVMESQGILVANRRSLLDRPGLLMVVHELIERFDAHLKAEQYYSVIVNMRGSSAEEVAACLLQAPGLQGLQGPTISPVYNVATSGSNGVQEHFYAATICVRKKQLYSSVKALQKLGGSGVLVLPMTYIFDEEPQRWHDLLARLGLDEKDVM
ncbi:ATP phosphoribosyl transferase [Haematococcus lacustris]